MTKPHFAPVEPDNVEFDPNKITRVRMRRRKYAELVLKTGDTVTAYKKVHPKCGEESARVQSKFLIKHPQVQSDIRDLLNANGVTIESLNKHLRSIIENSDKEVVGRHGEIIHLADKGTKLNALALGYKLHGAGEKSTVNVQDNRSITFNASGIPQEQVESKLGNILKCLTELNRQVQEEKYITGEIETSNAV